MAGQTFIQKIKVLLEGAGKASKDAKKVSKGMDDLAKTALKAGAAYFTAQGLIAGIKGATEAFAQQELAEKQLEFALGRTSNALTAQASALQKMTVFGDEAIIGQQAFLASLKFSEEQIKEIIPVAMDLAAATGMTLESAVRNTAKTFSGLAGELGELVPQLRGLTAEQMKAGDAVKVMADLFGGQAKAQTDTLSGSLQQMNNTVGDMMEKIGGTLAPVIIDMATFFGNAAESVGRFFESFALNPVEKQIRDLRRMGIPTLEFEKMQAEATLNQLKNDTKSFESRENLIALRNMEVKKYAEQTKEIIELDQNRQIIAFEGRKTEKDLTQLTIDQKEKDKEKTKEVIDGYTEQIQKLKELEDAQRNLATIEDAIAEKNGELVEQMQFANIELDKSNAHNIKKKEIVKDEFEEVNPLINIMTQSYEDFKLSMDKANKASIDGAMAIGAAQSHAGQAAADAAGVYITAEIQKALSTMILKAFGELGFFGGLGAVATAGATGSLMAQTIKSVTAAEGFEGIVDEPTLFLAGEEGPEYVDVEPTMNEGAGRGGANITITGNVLSRDFIEDEAVPMIREALRKGGDIGIG